MFPLEFSTAPISDASINPPENSVPNICDLYYHRPMKLTNYCSIGYLIFCFQFAVQMYFFGKNLYVIFLQKMKKKDKPQSQKKQKGNDENEEITQTNKRICYNLTGGELSTFGFLAMASVDLLNLGLQLLVLVGAKLYIWVVLTVVPAI